MSVPDQKHVAPATGDRSGTVDDGSRAFEDITAVFARCGSGDHPVLPNVPRFAPTRDDVGGSEPLISAVVPFDEVRFYFRLRFDVGEPCSAQARCRGLASTRPKCSAWSAYFKDFVCLSPISVNGRSVIPVCWPVRLQAVSPWRTRKTLPSLSLWIMGDGLSGAFTVFGRRAGLSTVHLRERVRSMTRCLRSAVLQQGLKR